MKAHNLSWSSFDSCIKSNLTYWQSATSKKTSMSGGNQKGYFTDTSNAPNISELLCIST